LVINGRSARRFRQAVFRQLRSDDVAQPLILPLEPPYLNCSTIEASGQMSDCLHCDINEIVQKHIDKADTADAADIAARMAESIADMILTFVPEDEQANVLAHTIAHLGEMFLQKGGAAEGDTTH
jgi:hypothetical protein